MGLVINGRAVAVERKAIKTLRLRLAPDGSLRVSVPIFATNALIKSFVQRSEAWIDAQEKKRVSAPLPAEPRYESGETVRLWGKCYTLRLEYDGKAGDVELQGSDAVLKVRSDSSPEKRAEYIKEWHRSQLKDTVAVYLPKWETITGLHPDSWQSKSMRTRWGSCNTRTKKIWLNVALAQMPVECLEYVIVHELAHLQVANHGPEFKAILDAYMPDWKQRRRLLNAQPLI